MTKMLDLELVLKLNIIAYAILFVLRSDLFAKYKSNKITMLTDTADEDDDYYEEDYDEEDYEEVDDGFIKMPTIPPRSENCIKWITNYWKTENIIGPLNYISIQCSLILRT